MKEQGKRDIEEKTAKMLKALIGKMRNSPFYTVSIREKLIAALEEISATINWSKMSQTERDKSIVLVNKLVEEIITEHKELIAGKNSSITEYDINLFSMIVMLQNRNAIRQIEIERDYEKK